jgi:hypothetical protein
MGLAEADLHVFAGGNEEDSRCEPSRVRASSAQEVDCSCVGRRYITGANLRAP